MTKSIYFNILIPRYLSNFGGLTMNKPPFFVIIFVILMFNTSYMFSQNYEEFIGLSRNDLEKKLDKEPVHIANEKYTYQIKPGNNNITNLISFFIDPVLGVNRIATTHEYNNRWIRNKVNELTKVYGKPDERDGIYAFRAKDNENILILVFSDILDNKRYGIIITMLLKNE